MGVYTEYFQKSKVFLYPLLKFRKGLKYVPSQTYIGWSDVYETEDMMFLCLYNTKLTDSFNVFAKRHLIPHPMYRAFTSLSEKEQLFMFDFSRFKNDWKRFIEGKYSQFSLSTKVTILDYFDDKKTVNYIQGFLSPEDVHEEYANKLNVKLDILQKVHEVCTAPDLEKEILVDNNYVLYQLLKESSISLTK